MNYLWRIRITNQNWSYVPACASSVGNRGAVSQNTGCVAALHKHHHHLGQQRNFLVSKNCTIISPPPTAMLYLQHGITFTGTIPPWISPQVDTLTWLTTQVTTNPAKHLISLETPVLVALNILSSSSSSTNFMIFSIFSHFPISRKHYANSGFLKGFLKKVSKKIPIKFETRYIRPLCLIDTLVQIIHRKSSKLLLPFYVIDLH